MVLCACTAGGATGPAGDGNGWFQEVGSVSLPWPTLYVIVTVCSTYNTVHRVTPTLQGKALVW